MATRLPRAGRAGGGLEGPGYLGWLAEQPEADCAVLMGAATCRLMPGIRFRVVVFPVITGGSGRERIYDGYPDVALDMISSRTFDGRIQLLEYVPAILAGPPAPAGAAPDGHHLARRTPRLISRVLVTRRVDGEVQARPRVGQEQG